MKATQKLLKTVERALDDAYELGMKDGIAKGKTDAREELLSVLSPGKTSAKPGPKPKAKKPRKAKAATPKGRKRAPRGTARTLVERAMEKAGKGNGVKIADIAATAENDLEAMVKEVSLRAELRKGTDDGRYTNSDGMWFKA
ncbi:hypothetical protein [Litoreibacter roseus]|uniref:Uncharacterized protein n=1 Tax=Litoreibacter roseus TaxID=2601869 RepID=A0A6N6JAY0_9RHOB|nr:hypothetical protein [Litoreibacter roseus]GFE63030.1 hypothetical protein KIN_01040 [Litoreibacter roseus]